MDNVTAIESVALNLEYYDKKADTESLRQIVCRFLNKNRNMKIKDNLSKQQRKANKTNKRNKTNQ